MKHRRWYLAGTTVLALAGLGVTWNGTWEAIPDGATALASDIDTFIKDLKTEIRFHGSAESEWGTNGNDNGLMRVGSSRAFIQNAAPTVIAGPGLYNSGGGAYGANALGTVEVAAGDQIGKGRVWVDLDGPDGIAGTPDDRSVATWDETNSTWKYNDSANATVATTAAQRFLFDPGKNNLIYNGSFEITDGTGSTGSTSVPAGWALSNATIAYAAVANSEGAGNQVNVTATAGNGSITQTLTKLKASTTYYAVARVKSGAGDPCDMVTTGGAGTQLDSNDVTSTSYATTSGTFITDATVTAMVLNLRSQTNTKTCSWDSVAVYETTSDRRGTAPGGVVVMQTQNNANQTLANGATWIAFTGMSSLAVVPPGPGYQIRITGEAPLGDPTAANSSSCQLRIQETGGGTTLRQTSDQFNGNNQFSGLSISWVEQAPTPGTTLTYALQFQDGDGAGGLRCGTLTAWGNALLRVEMYPVR